LSRRFGNLKRPGEKREVFAVVALQYGLMMGVETMPAPSLSAIRGGNAEGWALSGMALGN
jgi:hypothetical protein